MLLLLLMLLGLAGGELWEQDMSDQVYIEASHEGFKKVNKSGFSFLVSDIAVLQMSFFSSYSVVFKYIYI